MMDILNMISLVQIYIHHVKNVNVIINVPTNNRQLILLNKSYKKAVEWAKLNNLKIY